MNLHGLVSGAIGIVNPHVPALIRRSEGYSTAPDGTQTPAYSAPRTVRAQVQSLTYKDLQQIAGLNIQGEARAVYLYGNLDGVLRPDQKGGDILTIRGERWLTVHVLETWPDWCKLAVVRQL